MSTDNTPADASGDAANAQDAETAAAKAANADGVMLALALPQGAAARLEQEFAGVLGNTSEPIPAEQMHITLAYFANVDAIQVPQETLAALVRVFASRQPVLNGVINGKGQFNTPDSEGRTAVYATFDSPALPAFQQDLMETLDAAGVVYDKTHGFIPHITLGYTDAGTALADFEIPTIQVTFDAVTLAWGGAWQAVPLGGAMTGTLSADTPNTDEQKSFHADLAKWEAKALERMKKGGSVQRALEFDSAAIAPTVAASIRGALEAVENAADVKSIFKGMREWENYP